MNWIRRLFLREDRQQFSMPCMTCQALREQLDYQRKIYDDLQETMISLLKPVPVIQETATNAAMMPRPSGKTWSRRRAELEARDRIAARTVATSPVAAKSDEELKKAAGQMHMNDRPKTVEELEKDLGIVDSEHVDESRTDPEKERVN